MAKHAYQSYGKKAKPKRRALRILGRILGTILALGLLAFAGLAAFLTVTEYQPRPQEKLEASGGATRTPVPEEEFTIMSWNIGYGALSDHTDFFMDGGKSVLTATPERIEQNMNDFEAEISRINPEIVLLQEVDRDSTRSNHMDQAKELQRAFPHMVSYYATNYRTAFVPMGIPPYGKVESGAQTLSAFNIKEATRVALPPSYTWPLSAVQLKRCELVTRIPVEGSTHELVLINEHPDAYTDEEGRASQINAIRETLEAEVAKGNWVIAGGDWNHRFSNADNSKYPLLPERTWEPGMIDVSTFGEGWQFIMDASAPTTRLLTYPVVDENGQDFGMPIQCYLIDGFIVSENVKLVSAETLDLKFKASDHNPVVIKVLLEKD